MSTAAGLRHFLDIDQIDISVLRQIIDRALVMKRECMSVTAKPLVGRTLALIFEKPSTRTRVSFEVGMRRLGGDVVVLSSQEMQLGRGETIADTARVLSRYVNAVMLRTNSATRLHELARHASIPVLNGLTDQSHPCQVMADVMTFEEHRGSIAGRRIAWSGDCNNVTRSWIHAAAQFGFEFRLACPAALGASPSLIQWAQQNGGCLFVTEDPKEAVKDADCIVTDTWVSMNHNDSETRYALLTPYRVDQELMSLARSDAIFMHCLPAHRGDEVTDEVIDGPNSVVWDEAENRMHVQQAILLWCLGL
ncbi:Ornithine carbamoyltransferase [Azospirillaceae bacterium]